MCKRVDAALRVVGDAAEHAIHHARRACCRSSLSRLEDVQRKRVVGLVASAVGDGRSRLQAQLCGSGGIHLTLHAEGRYDVGEHLTRDAVVVQKELSGPLFLEVPHHPLGETADGCGRRARQAACDVVAWQHHLIYLTESVGLVLANPCQLRRREVARRIEQMAQALLAAKVGKRLLSVGDSARVAPDNRIAQRLQLLIHADQTVHLIGDADSLHLVSLGAAGRHNVGRSSLQVLPPGLRVLLCPAGTYSLDGRLCFWIEGRSHAGSALSIHEGRLNA